jgi:hypothetical protein
LNSVGNRERITIPDLTPFGRRDELAFDAAGSEIRPVVSLRAVPWLVVTYDEVRSLALDSRDGFVLSLVDGRLSVEAILDVAGFPEDETVGILVRLVRLGVIELRDPTER